MRTTAYVLLALVSLSAAPAAASSHGPAAQKFLHCSFTGAAAPFTGTCGTIAGDQPVLKLAPATAADHGVWRTDLKPSAVWAGDMSGGGSPPAFLQLEIYGDAGAGILRSAYGWFPVAKFAPSSNGLTFELDAKHEVAPNALDREIIIHAAALLRSTGVWNRADDRVCPATATTWSIYCAMEKATIDVTGAFDHRRPAMELVRILVEERSAGRNYEHRLLGYNNDPRTTLADVVSLFTEALACIDDPACLKAHDFVQVPGVPPEQGATP